MKPVRERIKIYLLILASGVVGILGLLVTGYDYSRARGFFLSEKRESMSLGESLMALPGEYFWFAVAFLVVVFIVELFVFLAALVRSKYSG